MAQNMRIRDTKIADDVYKKKELGWLDQEFTAYGTAYYENGEMYYRVSNHSKKIYSFMDEEGIRDIYFGNLIRHTERCPLPVGMKEEKNLEIKKTLAKTLEQEYPQELFLLLAQVADEIRNDSAYEILEQERESLIGVFDGVRLDCFKELVKYSYKTLKLERYHYNLLMKWIDREYKNLEDDFVAKKLSEGQLYGLMYMENGQDIYFDDALCEYIYEKKYDLEQKGVVTTPIALQKFWYDYSATLAETRVIYGAKLEQTMRDHYLQQVKLIRAKGRDLSKCKIDPVNILKDLEKNIGQCASATFERYLHQWDVK